MITFDATTAALNAAIEACRSGLRDVLTRANAKIRKGEARGYLTAGVHLAPAKIAGINVCPGSTAGCRAACLYSSGHGRFTSTQISRIAKTRWFAEDRHAFLEKLVLEIRQHVARASRMGLIPAIRLNLTSDLPWHKIKRRNGQTIMESFPDVQFYDYTKVAERMAAFLAGDFPVNYHLTFSRAETRENQMLALAFLQSGGSVAAVFRGPELPAEWNGFPVLDGDEDDLTFTRPGGTVFGLRPKGDAKDDGTGFVIG